MKGARVHRSDLLQQTVIATSTVTDAGLRRCMCPDPSPGPPPLFSREGMIGHINQAEGSITIRDFRYHLSPHVRVYVYDRTIKDPQALRAETRLKDGRALREGMHIGYIVEGEGGERGTLTEAWILPAGSSPELDKGGKSEGPPTIKGPGKTPPAR